MNTAAHAKVVQLIWNIADDCLRDVYVRGKYRDVILPMVVLRRLDALLEPTKAKVLEEVDDQKRQEYLHPDELGLQDASGYVFYNTSTWTLQRLADTATNSRQLLLGNFFQYLDAFSENVKEIIEKFKLREQIEHMSKKDILLDVLIRFTAPDLNLTPFEKTDKEGRKLPALSNLGMGYVFEELVRRFNEENNEEAGEHFTPREVIDLMTHLIFEPIKDHLPPVITIYDPACGSGGMLTESQNFIQDPDGLIRYDSRIMLYGKEINDETYAICKSDMMIKGNDPANIKNGSTLSRDEFAGTTFDFMLSNPPYGKSWASEVKHIKDDKDIIDRRFIVTLPDYWGKPQACDAVPRSADGQLLFLMEMVSKMKPLKDSPAGSRIASVHNGSSLFTGDAGGGESNIRRHIIERDLLEAIIQLPNNLFYNTGISTYIWLLSNKKSPARVGKVQLIDASQAFQKLRKNLGAKNCELSPAHVTDIMDTYMHLRSQPRLKEDGVASQVFDNADFGYYKVNIERPKRLVAAFSAERVATLRFAPSLRAPMAWAWAEYGEQVYTDLARLARPLTDWCEAQGLELSKKLLAELLKPQLWADQRALLEKAERLMAAVGTDRHTDFNAFVPHLNKAIKQLQFKLSVPERKQLYAAITWYDAEAAPVIESTTRYKPDELAALCARIGCQEAELPDFGHFPTGKPMEYLCYARETDLRDSEQVPLKADIHAFFLREVRPYVAEAWIDLESVKIGYEISFNKHFYRTKPLRDIAAISADIRDLELKSDDLIAQILGPYA